jgi:hypothetical protein
MIDFAKEARDLQVAVSANAYPTADGGVDIDNNARPIIEVTFRNIASRAKAPLVAVLASTRDQLVTISSNITSRDPFTKFDDDELLPIEEMIQEIDAALSR